MATTVDSRRETVSLIGSDKVESTPVYGGDDRKIGTVQRVMIDKISGKVAYAVISFGGFLGMGDRLFAVPWQALKLDTENKRFTLNASKEQLKNAPGFDKDHWPVMADNSWASDVHKFYGVKTTGRVQ